MRPVFRKAFLAYPLFVLVALLAIASASWGEDARDPKAVGGPIGSDTVWEGTVRVERSVEVNAGTRLTIRPGSRVLFANGTGLNVAGTLRAMGTSGNPVRFLSAGPVPGKGGWQGITLAGTGESSVLAACVVTNAEAVRILAGKHEITGCTFEDGVTGIFVGSGAFVNITGSTISGMTGFGVDCQRGAGPNIDNNIIRNCGSIGVNAQRDSGPRVTNTTVTGCDVGISYNSPAPSPAGNRIENNRVGIGTNNVGSDMSVTRSRFAGNGTGLWVENFSSPRIEGNVIDNNGVGIFCFRSSSPAIVRNQVVRNRQGIVCQQLSEPRIVANELADNRMGVFLTLSSYAVMNGNNFDNNAVQIELGVMSHEWEVKVDQKPVRGDAMRGAGRFERIGRPPPGSTPSSDAAVGSGTVDAIGNWWGDRDTAEMEAKGADANIGSLIDGRDVPPQKSEGYEGEFTRDRVDYSQWKAERIPDAGVPGQMLP